MPLVPVTATTGTRGVIVRGVVAGAGGGDPLRGRARPRHRRRRPGRASRTSATAWPITCARSRCTHGNATTIRCGSLVGRTRTASRDVPDSEATARTSRATARTANRCRKPDSARTGPRVLEADPRREPGRRLVGGRGQRADVEGQLDRRSGEVEVRSFEDPELDEGGGHAGTLACFGVGELGPSRQDRLGWSERRRPGGARLGDPSGVPYGGWCPLGGLAEDLTEPPGLLADYPELRETSRPDVDDRTTFNVRDSDATLLVILPGTEPSGGTAYTRDEAVRLGRRHLLTDGVDPAVVRRLAGVAAGRDDPQRRRAAREQGARHLPRGDRAPRRAATSCSRRLAGDRGHVSEGRVGPVVVVLVQPSWQGCAAGAFRSCRASCRPSRRPGCGGGVRSCRWSEVA